MSEHKIIDYRDKENTIQWFLERAKYIILKNEKYTIYIDSLTNIANKDDWFRFSTNTIIPEIQSGDIVTIDIVYKKIHIPWKDQYEMEIGDFLFSLPFKLQFKNIEISDDYNNISSLPILTYKFLGAV